MGTILILILAPLAAALVQMAISGTREYAADAGGADNCGNPLWLANALDRMERGPASIDNQEAEANPATAHMFIINPLHGGSVDNLFWTQPQYGQLHRTSVRPDRYGRPVGQERRGSLGIA